MIDTNRSFIQTDSNVSKFFLRNTSMHSLQKCNDYVFGTVMEIATVFIYTTHREIIHVVGKYLTEISYES